MRIISQGKHEDLPYEHVAICMACEDIIARFDGKEYLMGRYKTIKQAEKVMKMLHDAYIGIQVVISNTEISEELEEQFKKGFLTGFIVKNDEPPKIDFLDNSVFYFPKAENLD